AKKVQEQAQGKSGAATDDGQRALAEALGRIAELETELERTRAQLHDVEAENLQRRAVRSRPDALRGVTRRLESPLGTMYVTITEDDKGQPFEVFISLGKAGAPLMEIGRASVGKEWRGGWWSEHDKKKSLRINKTVTEDA